MDKNKEEVLAELEQLGSDSALDDLVHDTVSAKATEINNFGPKRQLEFLLEEGYSLQDILEFAKR